MKKLALLSLLALIINIVNAQNLCSDYESARQHTDIEFDEDFCSMLVPTDTGATHCCYEEYDGAAVGCVQITDDQYENIGRYIKFLEDANENDPDIDIDIDCSSKFLTIPLFVVFALLF